MKEKNILKHFNPTHYVLDDLLEIREIKNRKIRRELKKKILGENTSAQAIHTLEAYSIGDSLLIFPQKRKFRPVKLHLLNKAENRSFDLK